MSGTFLFVDEINIAFPILLVNRESDIFIEIPIFCVLIDKRKPTVVVGSKGGISCNFEEVPIMLLSLDAIFFDFP